MNASLANIRAKTARRGTTASGAVAKAEGAGHDRHTATSNTLTEGGLRRAFDLYRSFGYMYGRHYRAPPRTKCWRLEF